MMNRTETALPGVVIFEPKLYRDDRGHFQELWNQARYEEAGLPAGFVQDNLSFSTRGVLRGLHYQHPSGQGKLVTVLRGEVFDVAVDIRRGSPSFGRWMGTVLSEENRRQLYIPPGFAHGFLVTGSCALFLYKCTAYYRPADEGSVLWNDPEIGIDWPSVDGLPPRLSPKDAAAPPLARLSETRLPRYEDKPSGSP
jgi:dTDP-4-dehydrorhamnose 3,5-epimerase